MVRRTISECSAAVSPSRSKKDLISKSVALNLRAVDRDLEGRASRALLRQHDRSREVDRPLRRGMLRVLYLAADLPHRTAVFNSSYDNTTSRSSKGTRVDESN